MLWLSCVEFLIFCLIPFWPFFTFFAVSVDDVNEAYNLIKDLEPTTPQEYILKGVVNAALGQEQGSVCQLCIYHHSIIHDSV